MSHFQSVTIGDATSRHCNWLNTEDLWNVNMQLSLKLHTTHSQLRSPDFFLVSCVYNSSQTAKATISQNIYLNIVLLKIKKVLEFLSQFTNVLYQMEESFKRTDVLGLLHGRIISISGLAT